MTHGVQGPHLEIPSLCSLLEAPGEFCSLKRAPSLHGLSMPTVSMLSMLLRLPYRPRPGLHSPASMFARCLAATKRLPAQAMALRAATFAQRLELR